MQRPRKELGDVVPRVAKWLNKKLPALLRIEQVAQPTYSQLIELAPQVKWLGLRAVATLVGHWSHSAFSYNWTISCPPIRQNASTCSTNATLGTHHNHCLPCFQSDYTINVNEGCRFSG